MVNLHRFVLTATTFVGILYLVCGISFLVAPELSLAFFNQWFHGIDLAPLATTTSIQSVLVGFVTSMIVTAVSAAFLAWLWNTFERRFGQ